MTEAMESVDAASAARQAMLRLARTARANGQIHQAIHILSHLLVDYPTTVESRAAVSELISLAHFLEENGMYHTAMTVYYQLEALG